MSECEVHYVDFINFIEQIPVLQALFTLSPLYKCTITMLIFYTYVYCAFPMFWFFRYKNT